MNELLRLNRVSFRYEDSAFSLRDMTVALYGGERVAVLGGNGAGKSTFFLLCNGVLQPDSGGLLCHGQPIDWRKKQDLQLLRQRVGIVFQDPNQQLVGSTVEQEVSFGPMNLKLPFTEVARRVGKSLEDMELTGHRHTPPHYLSGGEKKRVTIADVLVMEPEIVLFDEPTASLDPAGIASLEQVLDRLGSRGKTLVVSTHDIDFAWRWARRVLVLHQGQLVADDLPERIFADRHLLETTGLRRPYLYDVALLLKERLGWPEDCWPKTIKELRALSER